VDEHIKRYIPKVKTYVRDTQDFITKIRSTPPLPEVSYLVTMDIVSLNTNIPYHEALVAIAQHLRSDPSIGPYILKLADLCLHNTNFEFYGEHYLQIGGTSMGNRLPHLKPTCSSENLRKKFTRAPPTNLTTTKGILTTDFSIGQQVLTTKITT
jgi:hypothetical protein